MSLSLPTPKLLDELRIPPNLLEQLGRPADAELHQGSIGIYVFNRQVLIDALATIRNSVLMGADFYQAEGWEPNPGIPPVGIDRAATSRAQLLTKTLGSGKTL